MKNTAKDIEITKELILPFVKRRKPVFEQPMLEIPLPDQHELPVQEENTKELELRGVWEIDI